MAVVKLADICQKIGSGATPRGGKEAYRAEGIALVRSQNVLDFSFSSDGLAYINDEQADKLRNVELQSGDVLLNITGDSVARACLMDDDYLPGRVNQHVAIIRVDESKAVNSYLLYYLQWRKSHLLQLASAGATRNALTKGMIEQLEIDLPSLDEQRKVVGILGSIQNKIKLNHEINDNLYAQVKAIFSENFLNLDFLPDGWKTGNLLDIADYLNGLAMQKYRPKDGETGLPVLKIKELRQGICDANSELCSPSIKSEYIIHDGDIIFSWSGSLLVDIWCGGTCGLNQHLFKVTSNNYDKWFYYLWTAHHLDRFIAVATDKATTMGHIKREELEKAEVIIPSKCDYKRISTLIKPLFDLIISNRIENRKLTALRNTLLPKIMSGEIDVSDIQI